MLRSTRAKLCQIEELRAVFRLLFIFSPVFLLLTTCAAAPANAQKYENFLKQSRPSVVLLFPFESRMSDPQGPILGSAFLLILKKQQNESSYFLITCKHVLKDRNRIIVRFDSLSKNGCINLVCDLKRAGPQKNCYFARKPELDLAAIFLDKIPEGADFKALRTEQIIDEKHWPSREVGTGSEIVSVAPIFKYPGKVQNLLAFRFGKIALMSRENWYNEREKQTFEKSFLADIHLSYGASGSPVFLAPPPDQTTSGQRKPDNQPLILGMVKGAPDVPSGRDLNTNAAVEIPQSLTAFEPSSSILFFLAELAKEAQLSRH